MTFRVVSGRGSEASEGVDPLLVALLNEHLIGRPGLTTGMFYDQQIELLQRALEMYSFTNADVLTLRTWLLCVNPFSLKAGERLEHRHDVRSYRDYHASKFPSELRCLRLLQLQQRHYAFITDREMILVEAFFLRCLNLVKRPSVTLTPLPGGKS